MITLARVDFRLVHGQVMTKWLKISLAKKIVIIDNVLANEKYMADIYKMSAPSDVSIDIFSVDEAVENLVKDEFKNNKVFLLFKDIVTAKNLFEKGILFDNLQVGGVPKTNEKKMIFKAVSLDKEDIDNLTFLNNKGVEVTLQIIPEESKLTLEEAIKKYESM